MKICSFIFILMSGSFAYTGELINLKDFLKQELSESAKISKESFSLNEDQKGTIKNLAPQAEDSEFVFYYGKSIEGKIQKACVVVPQQGKEGPMTIGVCYLANMSIGNVVILSAVEERGRKALEESYLKQYRGRKVSDNFQIGKDVDGVSGATWTSKAIAEAMRKSSFAFQTFVKGKIL